MKNYLTTIRAAPNTGLLIDIRANTILVDVYMVRRLGVTLNCFLMHTHGRPMCVIVLIPNYSGP